MNTKQLLGWALAAIGLVLFVYAYSLEAAALHQSEATSSLSINIYWALAGMLMGIAIGAGGLSLTDLEEKVSAPSGTTKLKGE